MFHFDSLNMPSMANCFPNPFRATGTGGRAADPDGKPEPIVRLPIGGDDLLGDWRSLAIEFHSVITQHRKSPVATTLNAGHSRFVFILKAPDKIRYLGPITYLTSQV